MLAIETFDLTKDYPVGFWRKRPKRALERLRLRVEVGEVFGLLGPNGAGKSTTLKLLLRLIFPTAGTARILGKELNDIAVHSRIGYLPENPYFYDHLTAQEFLNYGAELFGIGATERRRRVEELLALLGLSAARDLPLGKFSKGMVQRVGVAQALINDPEVIFLDEPMSGLDPLGRREVRDLILQLKREGKTIFFSTHILSDAETLCDRVAILNQGRLQGCGNLREILRLGVDATEVVVEDLGAELPGELTRYTRSVVRTGERIRLEVTREADVATVLDILLRQGAKIVSLNPVKMSLEDYFMTQMRAASDAAEGREGGPGSEVGPPHR
jgi:ABC-2 type transport system ATP-binding protein